MYFISNNNKFLDKYTSINDDKIRIPKISKENKVCLNISNFIFSFLLSSIIELWSFIPLAASANMQGINKIVWRRSADTKNIIPFPHSKAKYYRRNRITQAKSSKTDSQVNYRYSYNSWTHKP